MEGVPGPVEFAAQQEKQMLWEEGWTVDGESGDLDSGPGIDPINHMALWASVYVL